ncbi:MAG: Ig-like domain repeat protein [Solirubrobacteraceae bacterium]
MRLVLGKSDLRMRRSRGVLLAAAVLAVLVLFAAFAGSARAVACDTNWTGADNNDWSGAGNWDNGVPDSLKDACIDSPAAPVQIQGITANAASLSLTGVGTLRIIGFFDGVADHPASLTLQGGGTIDGNSSVVLTTNCTGVNCAGGGQPILTNLGATALSNAGTISAELGTDGGSQTRELDGNITNTGTMHIGTETIYDNGVSNKTLDNQGQINIDSGTDLFVRNLETSTVINDTGGSISNNGGTGFLRVLGSDTFTQAGGTTSPATANPANPAVIVDGGNLSYTGTGASTIMARDSVILSGNLAAGQNLVVDGIDPVPACNDATVTSPTSFTNAGTITETGDCNSSLTVTSGSITNTGALVTDPTAANKTHEISGGLINSGTLTVNGPTAFDGSSATLTQTAGKTTIGPGVTFDASGSGATFELQGGVLTGGGQDQPGEAIFNGSVENSGGNVIPGSATTPGLMTFDGLYTQGAQGKLTIAVKGAGGPSGVGLHYSQLGATSGIALGGTLAISTLANPTVGDLDTILGTTGGVSGAFSKLVGQFKPEAAFPPGWTFGYHTQFASDSVALSVDGAAGLRVKKSGPVPGHVTSSPAGINCATRCDAPFFSTQTVTLTAHPAAGAAFNGWFGACHGFTRMCKVSMSQARTVTARFSHPTTTSLRSSHNPGKVGQGVTYTATVTPHPNGGKVRFTDAGKTIPGCGLVPVVMATGKTTCNVTYHAGGTHHIQATYLGDLKFAHSSSGLLKETIRKS